MKPLFFMLSFCCFGLFAQAQWTLQECGKAAKKLQQLEQKISSGYSLKESGQLSTDQRELEKQLDQFCQKPITPTAKVKKIVKVKPQINTDPLSELTKAPPLYVSAVSVKAPYQGKKLQAWLEFYPEPKQCFGVRDSKKIVWCVEQRQRAKANFERQWQQKVAQSKPE